MGALISLVISALCGILGNNEQQQQQQHQQQQYGGYPGQQQQQYPPQQQHQQQQYYPPPHQQQQQHAPPHTNGHKPSKPPGGAAAYHGHDPNQINQHDPKYLAMRADAKREGDLMAKFFDQSHSAHNRGDGGQAKQLADQARTHQHKMEQLNKQASDWIFYANNTDSKPGEIDLHGLFVKEAIEHSDMAIDEAKRRGDDNIHFIVGKGLHSPGGHAKLKPAIEDLMRKHQIVAELDPHNSGVLIAHLNGAGRDRALDSGDITRRLEDSREDCIVM